MSITQSIYKRSAVTLFFTIAQKASPTASTGAYNLSGTLTQFTLNSVLGAGPVIEKSSSSSTEIFYSAPTSGMLEVYLTAEDTNTLDPKRYYYTLYNKDAVNRTYVISNGFFIVRDTVPQQDGTYT